MKKTTMTVWVAGATTDADAKAWEIGGIFSTEALAVERARMDAGRGWVGPVAVDDPLPVDSSEWVGAYYVEP